LQISGYPILNKASFSVFGAWWPTFNRAVMAIVWNGVNAVQGGQCIYVMPYALTLRIANIKNDMGAGSETISQPCFPNTSPSEKASSSAPSSASRSTSGIFWAQRASSSRS
jgi:hypothetical protein